MKYLMLFAADESTLPAGSGEQGYQLQPAYNAYIEAMMAAGVLLGGERLKPTHTATTVRVRQGKTEVLDGPYAETREQLGGYFLIEAPDLDAALAWAARNPGAANGSIEVRPIWPRA